MKLNVSTWSIHNPIPVILLFILLTLAGLMAFAGMKVQNFPDLDLPTVTVSAAWPGASPAQVETEVARRIENALATLQGVKHIRSSVTDGQANLTVEFQLEKPGQLAVDDVRDAIARVRADLPPELRDPIVRKVELAGAPILTYAIGSSRMDAEALSWFVDDTVTRTLLAVPGVGGVTRVGGASREVRVDLDPDRLLALNTTAADISRQLRQVQQEASGGRVSLGGAEQSVRTIATVATAQQIGAIELALADGRRIRLDEVAGVSDSVAEPRAAAFLDGAPSVGFEVVRARGAGELEAAAGVRAALAGLQARHPDLTVSEALNFIDQVEESYSSSLRMLFEGGLLAVIVVFAFLRDWRATVVTALALPLSVIPTFALMHALGFTLNIVTLLSLSLVVGVLVDDAIVEVENIERHLLMGKSPLQAAIDASLEIGLAVVATTFTLIAVFLPTAFMRGTAGKFFVQFGWTAAGAVFFSLVVARMLTPMMAAWLLRAPSQRAHSTPAWMAHYLAWAGWCLRHRGVTVGAAALLCAAGIGLASTLPTAFIPADDDAQTAVALTMPPGTPLHATVAMAERARLAFAQHRHVRQVYTAIGGGSSGDGGPPDASASGAADVRSAQLTLTLTPRGERGGVRKQAIERELRALVAGLPGVRIQVGAAGAEIYTLVLSGEDGAALARHAPLVERELRTLRGVGAVISSASLLRPELIVTPDFARAADLGVTSSGIAETLRIATVGDYQEHLAKLNLEQRQVPVLVRLSEAARGDLDTLKRLPVPGARGPVALEHVATLDYGSGPVEITRLDRRRHISFDIQLDGLAMGDVEGALMALPSLRQLPAGMERGALGDAEEMGELAASFGVAMLTGVLCIYMVLVLLLRGFMQPLTILAALVLSAPGAFLALFVTGAALSMPSMIGLIMLMGIATKNAILLVDYIVLAREEHGLGRVEAILDACRKRARPIVMTTVAMGAGMLPVALGWLGDPSFRSPMAIVVIGGLLTSTFLSLLVIPVVYSLVDDLVGAKT